MRTGLTAPVKGTSMRSAAVAIAAALVVVGAAACARAPGPSIVPPTGSLPSPSPSVPVVPRPSPPTGAAVPLPPDAARLWSLATDPSLGVDLRTPGSIAVRAGCIGYTGDLTTTGAQGPAAGAPAGPTAAIGIERRPDRPGTARCLGFSAAEQDFVAALSGTTTLTVVGDRLYLSGPDARLEFAAAS